MNAVNPIQSSITPGDHPPTAEPSMEEILASIRRIIADDQSFPGRSPTDLAASVEASHVASPSGPQPDSLPTSSAHTPHAAVAPPESMTADKAMHVLNEPGPDELTAHDAPAVPEAEAADAAVSEHAVHAQIPALEESSLQIPSLIPGAAGLGSVADELKPALAETIPLEPAPSKAPFDPPPARDAMELPDNLFSPAIDSSITSAFNTLAASRLVASSDELKGLVGEMIRPLLKAWIDDNLPHVVERLVTAEIERIARGGTEPLAFRRSR